MKQTKREREMYVRMCAILGKKGNNEVHRLEKEARKGENEEEDMQSFLVVVVIVPFLKSNLI